MDTVGMPRLVVAGLSGESGKTLVSLALLLSARRRGIPARGFKKGPDYIDTAWLEWATGHPARNLDTYLMGFGGAAASFARHAVPAGLNLIEGNRGLYDGFDARGTHSTAELAKLLGAPVLLVLNVTKMTRTAAALVLGCQRMDPEVGIAGVVLNQVCGARHQAVLREAIESVCGIPVLGMIPRAAGPLLPSRHLGLVTPQEHPLQEDLARNLLELTESRLEFDRLLEIAGQAAPLAIGSQSSLSCSGKGIRVGYLHDSAFTFYYPENLEALSQSGAELVKISPTADHCLPEDLDVLYIGGGFPETHAEALSANQTFLTSLRVAAAGGLPVYAECGGLMLLSRGIRWQGRRHPMAGVLPFDVEVCGRPQGHGYSELLVDGENAFYREGTRIRGHEFHYSRIVSEETMATASAVTRGSGCGGGRDGVVAGNVWASYTHVHASGTPEWAEGLLRAAQRRRWMVMPRPESSLSSCTTAGEGSLSPGITIAHCRSSRNSLELIRH